MVLKRIRAVAPFGLSETFTVSQCCDNTGSDQVRALDTPTWSPDGTKLTFAAPDLPNFYAIHSFDLVSRVISTAVVQNGDDADGPVTDPSYSPDGTLLAYAAVHGDMVPDEGNVWRPPVIEIIRLDTHDIVPFETTGQDEGLVFSPSGAQVVLMNDAAGSPNLFIANVDGSGRHVLTVGYSPDWQRVT
jgi:Tol biopolymer transport system component